jgi:hypothetical protein
LIAVSRLFEVLSNNLLGVSLAIGGSGIDIIDPSFAFADLVADFFSRPIAAGATLSPTEVVTTLRTKVRLEFLSLAMIFALLVLYVA